MLFTKDLILRKVEENEVKFFEKLTGGYYTWYHDEDELQPLKHDSPEYEEIRKQLDEELKFPYEHNWGDGNELQVVVYFPLLELNVLISGTYSSWDSSTYDSVYLAEPYQHTETRYRKVV